MTAPLAILKGTELETLAICIAAAVIGLILSLLIDIAKHYANKRARIDDAMPTDNRDFCEDLAEYECNTAPPVQAYRPPITDVLQ